MHFIGWFNSKGAGRHFRQQVVKFLFYCIDDGGDREGNRKVSTVHPMDAEVLICQIPSFKISIWIHQKFIHLKLQSFEWHTKIWECQRDCEPLTKILCLPKNNLTSVEWERVDLNGLGGELLIRTKQKYLTECNWIKMILQFFLEASATIRDVKEKQKILETILFPLFSFSHCSGNTVSLRSD